MYCLCTSHNSVCSFSAKILSNVAQNGVLTRRFFLSLALALSLASLSLPLSALLASTCAYPQGDACARAKPASTSHSGIRAN